MRHVFGRRVVVFLILISTVQDAPGQTCVPSKQRTWLGRHSILVSDAHGAAQIVHHRQVDILDVLSRVIILDLC